MFSKLQLWLPVFCKFWKKYGVFISKYSKCIDKLLKNTEILLTFLLWQNPVVLVLIPFSAIHALIIRVSK